MDINGHKIQTWKWNEKYRFAYLVQSNGKRIKLKKWISRFGKSQWEVSVCDDTPLMVFLTEWLDLEERMEPMEEDQRRTVIYSCFILWIGHSFLSKVLLFHPF